MTGRAICFGNTANGDRWVTSPIYANGMGTLSFEYSKAFTSLSARTLQVWVNGVQIGPDIIVNSTEPPVVDSYSQAINVGGPVQLQIRSTGTNASCQVKVDNIVWTPYTAGPTASFSAAAQSTPEGSGLIPVSFNITPVTVTGGTITLSVTNGAGVVYGAGGDYTTAPAGGSGTITVNVPPGSSTASFNVNLINDPFWEPDKTITFAVTGVTGDLELGFPNTHVFTILNDDFTPTAYFANTSANFLESAGLVNIPINITPAATAGTITLSITNGPGAVYGADYTTTPDGSSGSITLNVPAGATFVNIPVSLLDDVLTESTETVTFGIIASTGGLLFGPSPTFVLSISDNDSPPTVLEPGDLVMVGVNANNQPCSGVGAEDEISFFCFKEITVNTVIDLTDNGYERTTAGLWGDTEGFARMVRTGPSIPAGQVITWRIGNSGAINTVGPDAGWTQTLNIGLLNLASTGDQIFFMQGGTWTDPGGTQNASYVGGSILFGFSTNGQWLSFGNSTGQSGLPIQMECFSMEPTSASNWTKYTGASTPTTQRGWIIRVGDPLNWTTYTSCALYNSNSPNYIAGITYPITTVGFTPGLWTGGISTDWFDCKNWDDARVPAITDDVRIDQSALRSCEIGLTPGSTAACASLVHSSTGVVRNLTVSNSSTLQVNGPFRIERLLPTGALTTTVAANSTLQAASIELEGQTGGVNQATLRCEEIGAQLLVEGDLTIGIGGFLDLQSTLGNSGRLELGGDFINLNNELAFQDNYSTVVFAGNADQTIITTAGAEWFYDLLLNKTGGDLVLASPVEVRNLLDLSNGRLNSSAATLLSLRNGGAATNASDNSFVNGPMQKIGNTDFTFPVGKGSVLRSCALTSYSGANGNAFIAEYFPASPRTTFNNVLEPTLDHISDCEYWTIDRSIGSSNAIVTLTWRQPMSCEVTDLPTLRVARWDGSMWLDRGNNTATGTLLAGSIPTTGVQTAFSPWTLASISSENPLPITLLSFTAVPQQRTVRLDWSTATETNNDHFTVERSADGDSFLPLIRVEGAGAGTSFTPLHYRSVDEAPLGGQSYYRLRQTDLDGTTTLSNVVGIWMGDTGTRPLVVNAEADLLTAFHSFEQGANYTLLDMTGRLIAAGSTQQEGTLQLPLGGLPAGAYLLRMENGQRSESARFVR